MARMLGPVPGDRWERLVYHELKSQLPPDWTVLANVQWTLASDGGYVRDGQSDFVVLVPGAGMVVVEVKGTRAFWIDDDGCWYRCGRQGEAIRIDEPPPAQATRNMHQLVDVVEAKGPWRTFPGSYAYLVAYPNGEASSVPAMFDESTLVTQRHMHELVRRVRHALDRRGAASRGAGFTTDAALQVAQILTNRQFAVAKTDTVHEMQDDIQRVDELTAQQYAALRGVFDLPRVAVVGPAGSGKTLLATWRLRALLEEGKRALFVCFNKDLAAIQRARDPESAHAFTNVDKLFRALVPEAAVGRGGDVSRFFREELPSMVLDRVASMPLEEKFDAILIDEGQDFSEEQLIALHGLLKGGDSQWVFFADWRQDLFKAGAGGAVGADVVFRLHHNCRNTLRVNDATNAYLRQHIDSMPGMPAGSPPTVTLCGSRDAMAAKAWEIAAQWGAGAGAGVVILSPYKLENSAMHSSRRGHGLQLIEEIDKFGAPGTVYFSTVKSFKGIEAAGVIVIDTELPAPGTAFSEEDLYVACTRSTARLAILTTSQPAARLLSEGAPSVSEARRR